MLILSLPPVHQVDLLKYIIEHPLVGAVRYNTGIPSAYTPREAVRLLTALTTPFNKPLYIDLKGKQLRIVEWGVVPNSPIILNHKVEIELPATITLRGDETCIIREVVNGNELYVDSLKKRLVGKGQSVNIFAKSLKIEGGLLEIDHQYIRAALDEGVKDFMLSFVESRDDVRELEEAISVHSKGSVLPKECRIVFKIESKAGMKFVRSLSPKHFIGKSPYRLMAARDDLMIHVGLLEATGEVMTIVEKDPQAICASRLLSGLENPDSPAVTLADVSDIELMRSLGYRHFMLSDGISQEHAAAALDFLEKYQVARGKL